MNGRGIARWAGRALVAGLALLAALNVVAIVRNWKPVSRVSIPRGAMAPDVTLPLLSGGELRLAGERGHPVVLWFWASWCGPCMRELPELDRVARRFAGQVHFFAINTEGEREAASEAAAKLGLSMPVAIDDGSASARYHVAAIPHLVMIDAEGRVVSILRGAQREPELAAAVGALLAKGEKR